MRYPTLLALLPVAILSCARAQEAPTASLRYDFAYRTSDERIQIFDDGQQTFLLLPGSSSLPVATAPQPEGDVLLRFVPQGTYFVAPGVYAMLSLRWPNQRAVTVTYAGDTRTPARLGTPAAYGPVRPWAVHGALPPPADTKTPVFKASAEGDRGVARVEAINSLPPSLAASAAAPAVSEPEAGATMTASASRASQPPLPPVDAAHSAAAVLAASPLAPSIPPLRLRAGDRLRPALAAWLKPQSVELTWNAAATVSGRIRDVELAEDFDATSADLKTALMELLPPLGFDAEIVNGPHGRRVVVRNAGSRP